MKKKNVAIIGAGGFLGLSISKALSKKGYEVYGLIRSRKSNNQNVYNNLKIKSIEVGNLEEVKKINLQGIKFDT